LCLLARACRHHLSSVHPYRVGVQSEPGCSSPFYLPTCRYVRDDSVSATDRVERTRHDPPTLKHSRRNSHQPRGPHTPREVHHFAKKRKKTGQTQKRVETKEFHSERKEAAKQRLGRRRRRRRTRQRRRGRRENDETWDDRCDMKVGATRRSHGAHQGHDDPASMTTTGCAHTSTPS